MDVIKHIITNFNKIVYCKEETCTRILTSIENDYCIECESSIQPITCAICLDDNSLKPTIITNCGHVFHTKCFRSIPHESSQIPCPLCRHPCHYHLG